MISRPEILQAAWGSEHGPRTDFVDVHVGYLRRKLGEPGVILAVRSRGYRLRESA